MVMSLTLSSALRNLHIYCWVNIDTVFVHLLKFKSLILIPRAWIRRKKGLNEVTLQHKSGYGLYKCSLSRIRFAKESLLYDYSYS